MLTLYHKICLQDRREKKTQKPPVTVQDYQQRSKLRTPEIGVYIKRNTNSYAHGNHKLNSSSNGTFQRYYGDLEGPYNKAGPKLCMVLS